MSVRSAAAEPAVIRAQSAPNEQDGGPGTSGTRGTLHEIVQDDGRFFTVAIVNDSITIGGMNKDVLYIKTS